MEKATRANRALADRLVDAACLVFAAWTILCHGVVFTGQSLIVLIGITLAAAVSAGAVLAVRGLRAKSTRRSGDEPATRPTESAPLAVTGFAASDVTWLVALAAYEADAEHQRIAVAAAAARNDRDPGGRRAGDAADARRIAAAG